MEWNLNVVARNPSEDDTEEGIKRLLHGWQSGEGAAFVHVDDRAWETLQAKKPRALLVRFSENDTRLTAMHDLSNLRINCFRKSGDLDSDSFHRLIDVAQSQQHRNSLQAGVIPGVLRDLVRTRHPHYMRALHILLQGILASYTTTANREDAQQAMGMLKIHQPLPISESVHIDRLRTIRDVLEVNESVRAVAEETIKKKWEDKPDAVHEFGDEADGVAGILLEEWGANKWGDLPKEIRAIWESILIEKKGEVIDPTIVRNAFKCMEKELGRL